VIGVGSGADALARLEANSTPVDLILSDVVMPGLSAKAVGDAVARLRPTVPILFMSGYPGHDVVGRGLLSPDAPFLQKPFAVEELARSVRGLLDRVSGGR